MLPGGGVENYEEYVVSKSLLLDCINSSILLNCFTKEGILSINDFLNSRIFPNEKEYLAYTREELFNFNDHSNSGHEGTNNGIKSLSNGVLPTDSLALATKKMAAYDRARFVERGLNVVADYSGYKLYHDSFANLTMKAIGIITRQERLSHNYVCGFDTYTPNNSCIDVYCCPTSPAYAEVVRTKSTREYTSASGIRNAKKNKTTKKELSRLKGEQLLSEMNREEQVLLSTGTLKPPSFIHVRKLSLIFDNNGNLCLQCSCKMDNRCGIICRHKFTVHDKLLKPLGFADFNYRSVHCTNWSQYCFLAKRSFTEMSISEQNQWTKFQESYQKGYEGTFCNTHKTIRSLDVLYSKLSEQFGNNNIPSYEGINLVKLYRAPAIKRVQNFSIDYISKCVDTYGGKNYDSSNMLSQMTGF